MSLGCDEIVVSSTARFGDAGPVFQDEDALFRHAPEKIRSHLVRSVRDLAEATGRPPALAKQWSTRNWSCFAFVIAQPVTLPICPNPNWESSDPPNQWEKLAPVQESRKGLFLEVSGDRAVELQLASTICVDPRSRGPTLWFGS